MRKKSEILEAFADRDQLACHDSFFLVGIGGAGMSALAKMLKDRGKRVRGTDSTASQVTAELIADGVEVHIGHRGEPIEAGDAIILTDAIDLGISPEVRRARELGCLLFRRSQLLGYLLSDRKVIAVTGTHGKTTTTGLTGSGLVSAGFDPLIVVGASIPEWGSPVREGEGEWAVVEACEAYDSFHDLDPAIVVLTNLEMDHSDFHGNYENLRESVLRFVNRASIGLIYCESDEGAREIADLASVPCKRGYTAAGLSLALPGEHNRLNAGGAFEAAHASGVQSGAFRCIARVRLRLSTTTPTIQARSMLLYEHFGSDIRTDA
jgi:UDP-N-acetylmuramate--alanine ligase